MHFLASDCSACRLVFLANLDQVFNGVAQCPKCRRVTPIVGGRVYEAADVHYFAAIAAAVAAVEPSAELASSLLKRLSKMDINWRAALSEAAQWFPCVPLLRAAYESDGASAEKVVGMLVTVLGAKAGET
jgi:hypothetical protein